MSLIVPDAAKIPWMKIWTGEKAPVTLTIKLFRNDYVPVKGTVLGSLTEATFTGYASIDLTNPVTQPALDGTDRAWVLWDLVSWTKAGATGNTIYGYWVEDDDGNLLYVERFDSGGWAMTVDGTILQFYPRLTERSQFSN